MRAVVAGAIACLSLAGLAVASEVQAAIKKNISIPAGGLGPALHMLSSERDIHVIFVSEDVNKLSTRGVRGDLTIEEVLNQLLNGTGLTYQYIDAQTVSILPVASEPAAAESVGAQPGKTKTSKSSALTRFRLAQVSSAAQGERSGVASAEQELSKSADAQTIDEIVVTAQKREERLRDVPISISVIAGPQLDKSTAEGMTETLSRVPGVAVSAGVQGGGTQITVRGVTASGSLFSGSSPVAYYVDTVPFGLVRTAIAPDPSIYDLQRVEVLRGPQGTLYGASALNGVVRLLTNDANLSAFELKARGSASSTDGGGENYRGDVAVNVPIIEDKLAVRAVLGEQSWDGWVDSPVQRDVNDSKLHNYRLKIGAQPTENLSIGLSAWRSQADYGAPSVSNDAGRVSSSLPQPMSTDYDIFGLDINYDFSAFQLSSRTSYIDYSNGGLLDGRPQGAVVSLFTGFGSTVFTQEVLLTSSSDGPWQWSMGAFYRDAEDDTLQVLHFPTQSSPLVHFSDFSRSTALFGEISRTVFSDRLKWSLGLRYFHDDNATQGFVVDPNRYSSTSEATTPRAVLTWIVNDNATLYASYAQGFRSGFAQNELVTSLVPGFPAGKPDKLHNYEIGAKGLLWDRVSFDAALFYIDWRDIQQALGVAIGTGGFAPATVNGTSASGMGADLALTIQALDGLEFGAAASWNDLTEDEDVFSSGLLLFEKGERLNASPEHTVTGWVEYATPLGSSGFTGRFSASANYTSRRNYTSLLGANRVLLVGDSILIGRSSIAVDSPSNWSATLFVDNFNNERGAPTPNASIGEWSNRLRPRTIGLQLDYRFE